jgi:hypothetical protein
MTFRARIAEMRPSEAKAVMDAMVGQILDETTNPVTRYKLSQLCSAVHTFKLHHCQDIFREHLPAICEMIEKLGDTHPLSRPIAHLLTSLLADVAILPLAGPENGRRLSHGAVRLCGRSVPRQALARTPQPNSGGVQEC